ncbi:MAG: F0F1 ATP synthase subunit delta [Candidatus Azobacteroides sp.]|nr:F0F1 ATP synthase subunit delta [Candidatus Azobacteroides sp.]
MNTGIISTRYARAIYAYAAEKGNETIFYEKMQVLEQNFVTHPALRRVMNDPTLSQKQKANVLTIAAGIQVHEMLEQVIQMVVENGRAGYMENIALMYNEIYRKAKGMVIVHLTTAEPVDEKVKEALIPLVSTKADVQVSFHAHTDADIIGGFILEIEDKRLDASVKEQLRVISYNL